MNLTEKIEQIRRQPQHIRLRWVWGSVIVSMLLIFVIWLLSITLMFKTSTQADSQSADGLVSDLKTQISNSGPPQAASLEDYASGKSLNINSSEGVAPQKAAQPQNTPTTVPAPTLTETPNQSTSYTGLGQQGQ
jgi:hypothetical protein